MDQKELSNIFAHEDTHFYYVGVHDLVRKLLSKYGTKQSGLRILDAGCGTGSLANQLKARGNVTCVDADHDAVSYARGRGLEVIEGSIESLPFEQDQFDVIFCIDVLYHQKVVSVEGALAQFFRVLKPGGILILRVPAKKILYSNHDKFVHTARRFEAKELKKQLLASKFSIKQISFCQSFLFLPALLKVGAEKLFKTEHKEAESSVTTQSNLVNGAAIKLSKFENSLLANGLQMPVGLGLVGVCQKPLSSLRSGTTDHLNDVTEAAC